MKKVLLLSAAVLAMTACSNTDVIEEGALQQTNAIGFQSMVNKGSRALDATNFSNFYVFGSYLAPNSSNRIQIFNNVEVTKEGEQWKYNDTRYWVEGGKYTFFAYSNDNTSLADGQIGFSTADGGILNIRDYVVNTATQKDLIFAKTAEIEAAAKGNAPVDLKFSHALSRIMATFKSGFPDDYDVKISKVKVNGIYTTGDYVENLTTKEHSWTAKNEANGEVESTMNVDIANAGTNTNATTNFAYVLPHKYEGNTVSITFTIDVTHNGTAIFSNNLRVSWAPNWEVNKSYNYNITITGSAAGLQAIEFTANIGDWAEGRPTIDDVNLGVDYEATASE